ncbi:MAG: hypothetical protein QME44_08645 [Thermodesulfobacteriota bacterium]|nr:hypothetical protein [Thermodesulfobacteriota bacterium]
MTDDISAALLYQIKKEIAENYFGARKAIEEEKAALKEHIQAHRDTIGKMVYEDFCRIYQLLRTEDLVEEFWGIVGLEAKPFYDRYLQETGDIKSCLLTPVKVHGLTEAGRYKNLLLDCYKRLLDDLKRYRAGYYDLMEECLIINEEIKQLTASYNLNEILTFVRSIEDVGSVAGVLGETIVPTQREDLEKKLALSKLNCPGENIIEIPPLPGLSQVKTKLKHLAEKAYQNRKVLKT